MAKATKMPSSTALNSAFIYDPETGDLYKRVGHESSSGYTYIYLDGRQYPAHRVIWKMETGREPEGVIEHINGNLSDNRIENLRDVSVSDRLSRSKNSIAAKAARRGKAES